MSVFDVMDDMSSVHEQFPGDDSRSLLPDVCVELRRAVVDAIRNDKPSSVLGLLAFGEEPLTVPTMAGLLSKPIEEVRWTVEMLEAEDLCVRIVENGLHKVRASAPFSSRNAA